MTNEIRHVATHKAVGWQVQSHMKIQRENIEAVTKTYRGWELVWSVCGDDMDANKKLTLSEALARARGRDKGAA